MGGGGNNEGGLKGAVKDLMGGPKSEGIGGLSGGPESQVACYIMDCFQVYGALDNDDAPDVASASSISALAADILHNIS